MCYLARRRYVSARSSRCRSAVPLQSSAPGGERRNGSGPTRHIKKSCRERRVAKIVCECAGHLPAGVFVQGITSLIRSLTFSLSPNILPSFASRALTHPLTCAHSRTYTYIQPQTVTTPAPGTSAPHTKAQQGGASISASAGVARTASVCLSPHPPHARTRCQYLPHN